MIHDRSERQAAVLDCPRPRHLPCSWPESPCVLRLAINPMANGVVPDKHRVPRPGYSCGAYAAGERDAAVAEFNDGYHGH